jgi:RimJ/RimL family protein N-acetyltransferase
MLRNLHLNTKRLSLCPVTLSDLANLVAIESDAEVMRYLNDGQPVPEEGLTDADFLTPRGQEPEVLTARDRTDGNFVGWFGLFDEGLEGGVRTAEVGYRLAREAWGKGYATEGVRALIGVAFTDLGFDKVRAETMAANHASRRVMEKAGMHYVKTFFPRRSQPIRGDELGEVVYEICRR